MGFFIPRSIPIDTTYTVGGFYIRAKGEIIAPMYYNSIGDVQAAITIVYGDQKRPELPPILEKNSVVYVAALPWWLYKDVKKKLWLERMRSHE